MKFSHSIQLNASPEWRDKYMAYSNLKKLIYAIERATMGLAPLPASHREIPAAPQGGTTPQRPSSRSIASADSDAGDDDEQPSENTPLVSGSSGATTTRHAKIANADANAFFELALDEELEKIKAFYAEKELELTNHVQALINEIRNSERHAESNLLMDDTLPRLDLISPALHPHPQQQQQQGDVAAAVTPTGALAPAASGNGSANALSPHLTVGATNAAGILPQHHSVSSPSQTSAPQLNASTASGLGVDVFENNMLYRNNRASVSTTDQRRALSEYTTDDLISYSSTESPRPGYLPVLLWSSKDLKNSRQKYQKLAIALYVQLSELRSYVEIHETGFGKILKKYEKVVGAKLKRSYMVKVESSYPFLLRTKDNLARLITQVTAIYARIATDGKIRAATVELSSHLRDHVVWERNTIWRDMIESERRRETIGLRPNAVDADPLGGTKFVQIQVCGCSVPVPRVIPTKVFSIVAAVLVLSTILQVQPLPSPEQNGCLGILVFASMLWATEALPLFITSIIVPLLVVVLQVMRKEGHRLTAKEAAKQIFSDMFGPVIMLLLGGFSLAGALSKHNIAKEAAAVILGRAGSNPRMVLLANMFVSTFASMWISNVAAPVLCFSLVQPILRNLPRGSRYARCLVMGIALAANVGGMASPIASPQNIIAMANMNPPPSWPEWFLISLPICVALDACIWCLLLMVYRPENEAAAPAEIYNQEHFARRLNTTQVYILLVSIATISLWCVQSSIEGIIGDMGVVAIIPIVAFYGTGVLTKDDWNSMLWNVVMLAMGGIALGKAVDSSGLLAEITASITPFLQTLPTFACIALLTAIVVVVTSFISHTVGALIILPVVAQIGAHMPDPRARTLVMASALLCSGGMALPVSSFPNMNAISLEDQTGTPWLKVADFLRVGIVSTGAAWVCVLSIGYGIMTLIEFR